MTTKQRRGVVGIMGISFLSLVLVGCTTIYEFPMDPVLYPQEDKIDLKVGIHLSEELRNAKWERKQQGDTFIIRLGKALCENAEALYVNCFPVSW